MGSNAQEVRKSGPQRAYMMQTREETNTEGSLLNTPSAVPLTTLPTWDATPMRIVAYLFRPPR